MEPGKASEGIAFLLIRRQDMLQINRLRNEHGNITTDTKEIQNVIREYFENLCSIKSEKLSEMGECLGSSQQPKLKQEERNS